MTQKTRTCTLCKKRRKIKFFEAREQVGGGTTYRGICKDCHVIDRNRKRSSSYKSFLNLLHNQLRHTRVSKNPERDWEITPERFNRDMGRTRWSLCFVWRIDDTLSRWQW